MTDLNPCLLKYTGAGYFDIATNNGTKWEDNYFKCSDLAQANQFIESNKHINCYNSIASFKTPQKNKYNVLTAFLHYADIDSHIVGLTKSEAKKLIKQLITHFTNDLPEPSVIIFTGRGIQLIFYLYGEIDLIKWEKTQEAIYYRVDEIIKNINVLMGAELNTDRLLDPVRVLRTPGTRNTAANCEAEIIYTSDKTYTQAELLTGYNLEYTEKGKPRPLKDLENVTAESILNATPRQLREYKSKTKGFTIETLNKARVEDFIKLISIRNRSGQLEGYRNRLINICCEIIRTTTPSANSILKHLQFINGNFERPLKDNELLQWVNLKGRKPAYYFQTATIIKLLEITEAEQLQMKTLRNRKLVNNDYNKKHREQRRDYARGHYQEIKGKANQAARSKKIELAKNLKAQGYRAETIAIILNVTRQTVYNYLNKCK